MIDSKTPNNIGLTFSQIQEVWAYQAEFNSRVIAEWPDRKTWPSSIAHEWALKQSIAFINEYFELYDSTSWKWWKKGEDDIQNIHVEIVDAFHFLMSIYQALGFDEETFFKKLNVSALADKGGYRNFLSGLKLAVRSAEEADPIYITQVFVTLCQKYKLSGDMLYNKYMAKLKVNHERQNKGYSRATKDVNDSRHI